MKKLSYMNKVFAASVVFFLVVLTILSVYQNKKSESNLLAMEELSNTQLSLMFAHGASDYLENVMKNPNKTAIETGDYDELFASVRPQMEKLTVLKIKIFSLTGLTVFSTEKSQVGDDKSKNAGFRKAMSGVPASELTHRDTFSKFEQEVEDRDVISSYVPVYVEGMDIPVGVYEIYSDVTPLLADIRSDNRSQLALTFALFLILVISLYLVIRRAEQMQNQAVVESEQAKIHVAQSEKMVSLGEMVAAVSHELNTPIAYTKSNVSLLQDALADLLVTAQLGQRVADVCYQSTDETVRIKFNKKQILAKIPASGMAIEPDEVSDLFEQSISGLEQMSELVKNLRDFTRIDRESVNYFDLNESVNNVLYICRSTLPTDVNVIRKLGKLEPVSCLPSEINQVLINLVQNAAQAGASQVVVKSFVDGENVKVTVSDNGSGIDEDTLPNIFDSFFTTKERGKGTGLGLYISKELMQRNGGDLTVKSQVGVGTEFTMSLPVREETVYAAAA